MGGPLKPPSCLRKPTSSTPSPTPPSSSSRRPSASWTQTRTVYCRLLTFRLHLLPMARVLVVERPRPCSTMDGPMNFTQMVTLFASKMAGGSDDDDVILASFECFENDGKIDAD